MQFSKTFKLLVIFKTLEAHQERILRGERDCIYHIKHDLSVCSYPFNIYVNFIHPQAFDLPFASWYVYRQDTNANICDILVICLEVFGNRHNLTWPMLNILGEGLFGLKVNSPLYVGAAGVNTMTLFVSRKVTNLLSCILQTPPNRLLVHNAQASWINAFLPC